jgi:xanthine dehydrogenase YagS FAD-binding subunit
MINFEFSRASDVVNAIRKIPADPQAKFIAGGTNLIDLMKYDFDCTSAAQDREGNNIIFG